ncbi:hypothetical protein Tco_0210717 [Tanacetum coccineum]
MIRNVLQKNPAFPAQSSFTPAQPASRVVDKMDRIRSYLTHDKHQDLYDALLNLIMLDEAIASGNVNPNKVPMKRDRGDDQDLTARSD